jgi:ADP-heptose:LPS heptosyltransferase
VPLTRFAEFAKIPCITLCSLQKNVGSEQLLDANVKDVTIHDFGSLTAPSFADTAALLQSLDLVLTIDTAIGHIAGALGVPVWVLIPAASDWRWLNVREDTPWYPTMRLFRQPKPGDWDPVFTRLTTALLQWPERLRKALAASRGGNK